MNRSRFARLTWPLLLSAALHPAAASAQAPPPPPPSSPPEPASSGGAEEGEVEGDGPPIELDTLSIVGAPADLARIGGSAHAVSDEELRRFEDDNPERVLLRVPGVYIRGEDGYGLRPNIGMRGANSDRSKKVTLMEDGVLFGPAPYSAPAAYYFPILTRMTGVEVFKGPASIQHGPQTIGGAINLLTRPIPEGHAGGVDIAGGSQVYGKGHAFYGWGGKYGGFLVEGVRLRTSGFKEIDVVGGDTGFRRNELMLKGRVNTDPDAEVYHALEVKLGYSDELSNETYLGLSDADFARRPNRRYAGSQLDRMEWDRTQAELAYVLAVGSDFSLRVTGYRHDLARTWSKLNRFADGPALEDILADPTSGRRRVYHDVLTGREDSVARGESLMIGTNDRSFVAQGVQATGRWSFKHHFLKHLVRFGARYHHDQIDRYHTEDAFLMRSGRLVAEGRDTLLNADTRGSASALAVHVSDEVGLGDLVVAPGVRTEIISTELVDHRTGVVISGEQQVVLPGVGVHYALTDRLGVLAGVHQGFSPVTPGQVDARPELAVNYEAGARYGRRGARAELIGFFSDYSNITGQCTFSSGCREEQLDQQFDGGAAHIYGLEASLGVELDTRIGVVLPLSATYTLTQTRFLSSFTSDNPEFGDVAEGDELPYVPAHQLNVTVGAAAERWGANLSATYVGVMREQAGQGEVAEGQGTDPYAIFDALAWVRVLPKGELYARVENLFDAEYVVARRPFGARPGRTRALQVGFRAQF